MKQRLAQYKGVLTSAQIAAGMNAASRTARRLAGDAQSMLDSGRYPTAFGLAALSIEESGKSYVLRELALARDHDELSRSWRDYRTHTSKNQLWILVDSALRGASKLQDFAHLFDPDSNHPHILDQLKQISLYTDCLGKGRWSIPDEIIDADIARALVAVANVLSHAHEVTADEIDLWILHLQPVWKTTPEAMERGLVAWDKAMRARGLLKDGDATMEDFITTGIKIPSRKGT